jgi:hypothetical protein
MVGVSCPFPYPSSMPLIMLTLARHCTKTHIYEIVQKTLKQQFEGIQFMQTLKLTTTIGVIVILWVLNQYIHHEW